LGGNLGLTGYGRDFVRRLNQHKILVDLAHISPAGFWDAVHAHERNTPFVVTHTGVSGVFPHWRNLGDDRWFGRYGRRASHRGLGGPRSRRR